MSDFDENDVEIVEKSIGYDGYSRLDVYKLKHRLFDGGWSPVLSRELLERGHAVAALPYDPIRDEVVLLEQFRVGALAAGLPPWQIEIVAGVIDAGDTPEQVVHRETREECGCDVAAMEHITDYLSSSGILSEILHVYCVKVDATHVGGIHGVPEEGEDIRVFPQSPAEAIARAGSPALMHAPSVIALQWLATHRERLRKEWS